MNDLGYRLVQPKKSCVWRTAVMSCEVSVIWLRQFDALLTFR
jgi:hypothetical protein